MSEQQKPRPWALWLPLARFGAFVVVVLFGLLRPAERAVASAMIGKPLPQFVLRPVFPDRPGLTVPAFPCSADTSTPCSSRSWPSWRA